MREIILTDKAQPDKTTIIIASKDLDLENYGLTSLEKEYIAGAIDKKEFTITINRYGYWIIFQLPEDERNDFSVNEGMRNAAFKVHALLSKNKIESVQVVDEAADAHQTLSFIEGLGLSNYQFLKYFTDKEDKTFALKTVTLVSQRITESQTDELYHIIKAVYTTRDLVNEPASFLTSVKLSEKIQQMGNEAGFEVEVFDKQKIIDLKMGGILAVNQGSSEPPTFTVMTWKPANHINTKPYVLVGKGIVYDSGGLSLKPTPDSMDYMKCDMAGAAAVAGTMYALAKNKVPLYTIALAPSTDNRLDALSYSPGDVITMHNGSTVEVLNTDAEGRLVLADALSFANQFDPELVITIATLTGAAHRAIGELGMVGMGNADHFTFEKLEQAGWNVYERIAEFPFWEEYDEMIKSDIADLKNIGGDVAGAITAGKFLEHFTNYPFIHLDIAGVAFRKKGKSYKGKGASGVGVRLLYYFLKSKFYN